MTLSFQTHHNGLETGFVERIWDGLIFNNLATEQEKKQWAGNLINSWFGFTETLFEREILTKSPLEK